MSKYQSVTASHANIRSIKAHFEELESFLGSSNLQPNIIGFIETWLKNDSQTNMYSLPAYHKLISCKRSWGDRGSVGLLLTNNIKYRIAMKDTVCEWLVVDVYEPLQSTICATYRCKARFSKVE